ncbi:protein mono-ADP-ribosyltransferase PARP12-like [Rhynchophorus ferrugineus]|uniref:protein mono-ADP-ribosyltransferase PARP12-like n=1 Tax=Rhynchophorus ferrugineus TaxID=354439 RepID=UPI003FCD8478
MGGIFDKPEPPPPPPPQSRATHSWNTYLMTPTRSSTFNQRAANEADFTSMPSPRIEMAVPRSIPEVRTSRRSVDRNEKMMMMLLRATGRADGDLYDALNDRTTCNIKSLPKYSLEYQAASAKFRRSLNPRIDDIEIIEVMKNVNPYVYASFMLKMTQKNGEADEKTMFHGTSYNNARKICENNFDWRLAGNAVGHIFGQGVSFAKRSTYACHYPRNAPLSDRAMVVADVLVSDTIVGDRFTVVPPDGYDATCKPNGDVIVKYDDGEYMPTFIIRYNRTRPLPPRPNMFRRW